MKSCIKCLLVMGNIIMLWINKTKTIKAAKD